MRPAVLPLPHLPHNPSLGLGPRAFRRAARLRNQSVPSVETLLFVAEPFRSRRRRAADPTSGARTIDAQSFTARMLSAVYAAGRYATLRYVTFTPRRAVPRLPAPRAQQAVSNPSTERHEPASRATRSASRHSSARQPSLDFTVFSRR